MRNLVHRLNTSSSSSRSLEPGKTRASSVALSAALSASLFIALASLAATLSSCAGTETSARSAVAVSNVAPHYDTPPLYRVSGGQGANLVLLGTIHLGPDSGWTLSPEATQAIEEASTIVMELDPRQITEEAVSNLIANTVMLDSPTTLVSVLRPETAKVLEEMDATVTAMGLPPHVRRYMKPWFVSVGLIESATTATDYKAAQAVEQLIMAMLGQRPLIPLETFQEQLGIFDDMPLPLQDYMLYDTLTRLDETEEGIEMLIQAWRVSDVAALEAVAREGIEELPQLEPFYQRLLDDRNRNWRGQLRPLLEDPKRKGQTILVAVGALHLVGPNSVGSLLAESGYRLDEISQTKTK
ncbi:MAG: TraB/GumN family protein [Myxococcota bacterium]